MSVENSAASADTAAASPVNDEDEISLLDLAIVLAKHKKLLIGFPALVAVLAAAIAFLLPNIYTGTSKLLPPVQSAQSATSAIIAQLGGLAGAVGASAGIKNPADMYIGMLKSRTVADRLIQRFDLMKVFDVEYPSKARKKLEKVTTIAAGKDGIITIEVDDEDPKRAAAITNAYVEELFNLTKVIAVTEASMRRKFFEGEFARAKEHLVQAEGRAREALGKGGLAKVDDQGRAMIETTARLRAQIAVKEVQIGAMRSFAAERNPDLLLAQQELESMRRELAKLEGNEATLRTELVEQGQGIRNLHLLRDVKYYETIYELLAKQFELAKIDEAKDPAFIQVIDKAIEPDRKSKPMRLLIVILATLTAAFLAVVWAFVREAMEKARADPEQAERLEAFRRYLSWR